MSNAGSCFSSCAASTSAFFSGASPSAVAELLLLLDELELLLLELELLELESQVQFHGFHEVLHDAFVLAAI